MKHAPDNLLPNSRLQSMKKLLALEQQPAPRTLRDVIRAILRPARKKEV